MAAEGVRYTPLGLHTARDMFYMMKMPTDMENWKKKKVTEVKLKSFNERTFFDDRDIIETARSVSHY